MALLYISFIWDKLLSRIALKSPQLIRLRNHRWSRVSTRIPTVRPLDRIRKANPLHSSAFQVSFRNQARVSYVMVDLDVVWLAGATTKSGERASDGHQGFAKQGRTGRFSIGPAEDDARVSSTRMMEKSTIAQWNGNVQAAEHTSRLIDDPRRISP